MMRTKLIYVGSIITTLIIGVGLTFLFINYYPFKPTEVIKTIKEVNITEAESIKTSIAKIDKAVYVLESYSGSRLIGSGTGFVYKQDDKYGYIITNHHVVNGSTSMKAIGTDGKTIIAKVLGSDEYADLAVLSIPKEDVLQVAMIGKSDTLAVGDTLFTVGSPLGKEYIGTVTKGILSGKNRTISVDLTNGSFIMEVLQTDAAINPGNSGGPLLNINGEVIGVNSLKLVRDTIEGMGFAIPIEIVMGTVDRLEKGIVIKRPLMGVDLLDVTDTYGLYFNNILLPDAIKEGTVIAGVEKGLPAYAAGIRKGDIILSINNIPTPDAAHFRFILYKYSIGDVIKVKYLSQGKAREISIVLDKSL